MNEKSSRIYAGPVTPSLSAAAASVARCEGFRVESPYGKIGVVDAILFGADPECPAALTIRSGVFGRGLRIVDIEDVEAVDERSRRVRVRSEGTEVFL
ncbi:MAG TPA: hypothetical protein VFJ93_00780 [Gaiellaceae bacterium]|nr:hypothetical protein [Gaiellaceae bacterium]